MKKDRFEIICYGMGMAMFWLIVVMLIFIIYAEIKSTRDLNYAAIPLLVFSVMMAIGATVRWKQSRSNLGVYFGDAERASSSCLQMRNDNNEVYNRFCTWVLEEQMKGNIQTDESTRSLWERWLRSRFDG